MEDAEAVGMLFLNVQLEVNSAWRSCSYTELQDVRNSRMVTDNGRPRQRNIYWRLKDETDNKCSYEISASQ